MYIFAMRNIQDFQGLPGLRKARGKQSAIKLAQSLDVAPGHVYNIEKGIACPSVGLLVKLSKELNVSTDQLLGLVSPAPSPLLEVRAQVRARMAQQMAQQEIVQGQGQQSQSAAAS